MPARQEPVVLRTVPPKYQLRAGDQLEIRIWRGGGGRVTVDREGKIRHALFGELDVSGWSEQDLREALAKQYGSQVVVKRTSPH